MKTPTSIRYVRRPDGLFFVTVLSFSGFGPGFIVQPAAFVRITGINPRSTLGCTSVNDAQFTALTGIVLTSKGADRYDDALLAAAGAGAL